MKRGVIFSILVLFLATPGRSQTAEEVNRGLSGAGILGQAPLFERIVALPADRQAVLLNAASDCNALLVGGVFDHIRVRKASDLRLAIDEWLCKTEFKTHDEAIRSGLSLGFEVYGVPLQLGGTFSDTQRETWKSTHCQSKKVNFSDAEQYEFDQLIASKPLLDSYTRCVESTSFGLQSTLSQNDNCTFSLALRYNPNADGDKEPSIESTTGVVGAVCPGLPPARSGRVKVPYGGVTYNCRRNERDAVLITINTTKGSKTEKLPPLPDRPPRPQEPRYEDRWFDAAEDGRPYVYDCVISSSTHRERCKVDGTPDPNPIILLGIPLGVPCGVCSVPPGAQYTSVQRLCEGACGWSYHRDPAHGYEIDFVRLSDESIRWYRRWQSVVTETYRMNYKLKRHVCVENCDYAQRIAEWERSTAESCGPAR